jgi:hypothetical protein
MVPVYVYGVAALKRLYINYRRIQSSRAALINKKRAYLLRLSKILGSCRYANEHISSTPAAGMSGFCRGNVVSPALRKDTDLCIGECLEDEVWNASSSRMVTSVIPVSEFSCWISAASHTCSSSGTNTRVEWIDVIEFD